MEEDRYISKHRIIQEMEQLLDKRELLREEIEQIDLEIERLFLLLDELEYGLEDFDTDRSGGKPSLTERIMGIPDDPRHPLSRKSFEDAFRRMGFPPRRRP